MVTGAASARVSVIVPVCPVQPTMARGGGFRVLDGRCSAVSDRPGTPTDVDRVRRDRYEQGVLAVRAGHAFDGDRFSPDGVTLFVEDGRITAVDGPRAPVPDGSQLLDLPRATVLPGLLDTHVHLCADSGAGALDRLPEFDDDALDAVIATSLARHLATGVTAVRDLGDRRWAALEWRNGAGAAAAAFPRPAISASGPPL